MSHIISPQNENHHLFQHTYTKTMFPTIYHNSVSLCSTHDCTYTTQLFTCIQVSTQLMVLDLWMNLMQMVPLLDAWKNSLASGHLGSQPVMDISLLNRRGWVEFNDRYLYSVLCRFRYLQNMNFFYIKCIQSIVVIQQSIVHNRYLGH